MSRTNFTRVGGPEFFLISSPHVRSLESVRSGPRSGVDALDRAQRKPRFEGFSSSSHELRPETLPTCHAVWVVWQPGFYLRLEAYGFMGLSEGDYSARRDSVPSGRPSLAL